MQIVEHSKLTLEDVYLAVRAGLEYTNPCPGQEEMDDILDWYIASLDDYVYNPMYNSPGCDTRELGMDEGICYYLRNLESRPEGFSCHDFWDRVHRSCTLVVRYWKYSHEHRGRTEDRLKMAETLLLELKHARASKDTNSQK